MSAVPDFATWMGIGPAGGGADRALVAGEAALGRSGVLHGGVTATLLEQAGRSAVIAALSDQPAIVQLASITVDYLRVGPD